MTTIVVYLSAAIAEIGGCYAFWLWLRLHRSPWWGTVGMLSLIIFAMFLTRSEAAFAGRAYAAYGGIYIAASLFWAWAIEDAVPDMWDVLGAGICLAGAGIILWAPRGTTTITS